jgi:MFS family permease
VSCLLLAAVRGGNGSGGGLATAALGGAGVLLGGVFLLQERRAPEPILPLELFRDRTVSLSSAIMFLVGATMFGSIVFLPLFLQTVLGLTATSSGLLLLPLMLGIVTTSVLSGRIISRTGRYRWWPVAGTATMTVGVVLLSRMDVRTSGFEASVAMVVVGLGIGMVMQVLVLAVQNTVPHAQLGVATSATNFFRSIGGTFGTATFGAIFGARLSAVLASSLPAGSAIDPDTVARAPEAILRLPEAARTAVVGGIAESVELVFLVAIPVGVFAFLLSLGLREVPLRDTAHVGAESLTEAEARPAEHAAPPGA